MRDHFVLLVNGKRHVVAGARAALTLSAFLREELSLVGTKIVCSEGDCGACSVLVGRPSTDGDQLEYRTVDSCIVFLYQLDGCHIVTVEGLKRSGVLSNVQMSMVDHHGSQCGFCTPGFVVAMHGLVEGRQNSGKTNGEPAASLSEAELRYGLSGNLCRCTCYVQILEAGAAVNAAGGTRLRDTYPEADMLAEFAQLAEQSVLAEWHDGQQERRVFLPRTVDEAVKFKSRYPDAKIVCGATDVGVQRNHRRIDPESILCLNAVKGFDDIAEEDGCLVIGAGARWSEIERCVEHRVPEYYQILTRFGSPQIRNMGTLGGNLANASPIADSLPFHYVTDSQLGLVSVRGTRRVAVTDFYQGYKQLAMEPDELIAAVHTPLPADDELLKLYKVSKRRDMDISTVTAAVLLKLDGETIASARLALGGVGATVVRLPKAERLLAGRPFTATTMREAGCTARGEITPISDVRASAEYRSQLAENLLAKSYYDLTQNLVPV